MSSKRSSYRCAFTTIRRTAPFALLLASTAVWNGCLSRPICAEDCRPRTTNVVMESISERRVDKIDLLFMIDNSRSMSDKQELLKKAVPDLVDRLVHPACIDNVTGGLIDNQPAEGERCPAGSGREFEPVEDIHIGVISSSLGASISGACNDGEDANDMGHLIGARPRAFDAGLSLADMPEGTPGYLAYTRGQDFTQFKDEFSKLVTAVRDQGCGYEASLESWYRFLVDPNPPLAYQKVACADGTDCAEAVGRDDALLAQRAAFLRPDSLLAVIMLSDENDCSMRPDGQFWLAAGPQRLPRAATICTTNPNDPCCYSCGTSPPEGCSADPICDTNHWLIASEDSSNLRCFDQKRRFGYDFLYPTERYVRALKSSRICPTRADLDPEKCDPKDVVDNPIYREGSATGPRPSNWVFLAGIVGVPWQDIRTDVTADGTPVANTELRFKTAQQMTDTGTWDVVVGDPSASPPLAAADPLMMESIALRSGKNPITGDAIAPPSAPPFANPMNGHEWNIVEDNDLQYACIFPLREGQRECAADSPDCDCGSTKVDPATSQNPLCQNPTTGAYGTTQYFAKAYPGTRHLQVLKDFGENSIVASICAKKVATEDESARDFGYRPAVFAIIDQLKGSLAASCLPRDLDVVRENGHLTVPCTVVEAVPKAGAGCKQAGRQPINAELVEPSLKRLQALGKCGGSGGPSCDLASWSLCEIAQADTDADGNGLADCLEDVEQTSSGWCYVDPQKGLGDEALVAQCDPTKRRLLRFVDPVDPIPASGGTLLIACVGAELQDVEP